MSPVSDFPTSDRRRLVAHGAIELLASGGVHGLTHRRLDKALELPAGSTSNVFRSRIDLLRGALDAVVAHEMVVVEQALTGKDRGPWSVATAADLFADVVDAWLRPENRPALVARYTLILEASRSEELAPLLTEVRSRFTVLAELLCAAAQPSTPSEAPDRALQLVAWADGVLIAHVIMSTRAPSRVDVRSGVERLLAP